MNKVMLLGNLGRDPETRHTTNGTPVTRFSVATNRHWRDRDGNRQEATDWHQVICFARQAEIAGEYLKRGRQVCVEGRLQTSSWDDAETGERRFRTEVICQSFQMLGNGQRNGGPPQVAEAQDGDVGDDSDSDDIPF